ncbi:hypothetical protein [Amycolatopsis coloradensis]|uniref:hypothetical protein n=1 Tax=Amycolatopsis coloradensis TaxID=76021 RepID=UPI00096C1EED|nr:hypothetical protein [Amycolatopsis coloradensis]
MPKLTSVAGEGAPMPEDPGFVRTDQRHVFLRAVRSAAPGWAGPFMIMEGLGESRFAAAVTTPFGDRLNEFGALLLDLWDREADEQLTT